MRPFLALVLSVSMGACGGDDAPPPRPDDAWAATLEDVRAWAEARGIPGVGIAVVLDGELAYAGGVGVRARGTDEPITGDTLFRSSSAATKPAVAVALLDLAEEGRLDLHAPVGSIVPEIDVAAAYAGDIDLDVLLLQRAGLEPVAYRASCPAGDESVLRYFAAEGELDSISDPGVIWEYTAMGSVAGAAVLETVEGRPFTDVLRDRVLLPAGMTSATFDPAVAASGDHALGHQGPRPIEPTDDASYRCGERIASTGLYASAADHGRFLELLLEPGRVLDRTSLDALEGVEHRTGFGADWSYGYQTYGLLYKGMRVFHHYGSSEGFTGGVSWIPQRGFGVVLLTNADEGARGYENVYAVEEMRWRIIDRFLGPAGAPPDETTPASTWGRYEGTFASAAAPGTRFVFTVDAAEHLTVSIEPGTAAPIVLTQGTIDAPYQGGDVFSFVGDTEYFLVGFSPGADGAIHWAGIYSSAAGHVLAERVAQPGRPIVTIDDYPAVDGSTSTLPLARLIACELLGLDYRWEAGRGPEGEAEIVPVARTPEQEALAVRVLAEIVHNRTHAAYTRLVDREADLIMVANPPSPDERAYAGEKGVTLVWEPLALDALVMVNNAANPVTSLTTPQIRSIYQAVIGDWSEVGGETSAIHPYVRPENSGSQQLFQTIVMGGAPMATWPPDRTVAFMGALIDMIRTDPLSIGYSVYYWVTYQYPSSGYRVLEVGGVAPTPSAIASGAYPFTAEVGMVTRADLADGSLADQLRDWLLGADGQTVVGRSGYVPIDAP